MDWYTADTIAPCNRPFESGEHMAVELAKAINALVAPTDTLFHLGDVCWRSKKWIGIFREMLNCRQVFLIRGNYDDIGLNDTHKWFAGIFDIYMRDNIIMCHFPLETWNKMHHGTYHLHGHCHAMLGESLFKLRADVGVDAWGYKPISRDAIETMMAERIKTRSGEELKEAKRKLHEAIPREHRKYERRSNNPLCRMIHVSPYDIGLQTLIDCRLDSVYSNAKDQVKKVQDTFAPLVAERDEWRDQYEKMEELAKVRRQALGTMRHAILTAADAVKPVIGPSGVADVDKA